MAVASRGQSINIWKRKTHDIAQNRTNISPIKSGTICLLQNLRHKAEKNGSHVKVLSIDPSDDTRYIVLSLGSNDKVSIHQNNLQRIDQIKNFSHYYTQPLYKLKNTLRLSKHQQYQLRYDLHNIFEKECYYLPQLICHAHDQTLFRTLYKDIEAYHQTQNKYKSTQNKQDLATELRQHQDYIDRAKHNKHKDSMCDSRTMFLYKASMQCYQERVVYEVPDFSLTFTEIVNNICHHFNCRMITCLINLYENSLRHWSKYHYDKYKYVYDRKENDQNTPNLTIGVSFGSTRDLSFMHVGSGLKFDITQRNGDVFAFTQNVNSIFKHGIPKTYTNVGPRISIIIWAKTN